MCFLLYVLTAAWQDGKRQVISGWLLLFFFVHFFVSQVCWKVLGEEKGDYPQSLWFRGMAVNVSLWYLLAGCMIGILLLLISKASCGALGSGDGLFFFVTGIYLGFWKNLFLFCSTLFLCSIFGLIYVVSGSLQGKDYRKKSLPFLIITLPAGIFLVCV